MGGWGGGGVGASGTWPLERIQKKELHGLAVGVPRPALPPSGCVSDRFSAAPNSSPIASTCCCPCKQAWAVRGALWRALCNEDGVAKVAKEQKKKRTTTIIKKNTYLNTPSQTHTLATKHTGSMHWHCTEHLQEADAGRREGGGGGIHAEGCSQPLVLPVLAMDVGVVAVWWPTRFALTDSSQGSQ